MAPAVLLLYKYILIYCAQRTSACKKYESQQFTVYAYVNVINYKHVAAYLRKFALFITTN